MKTNLQNGSRESKVEGRATSRSLTRRAGTPVPIRHVRPTTGCCALRPAPCALRVTLTNTAGFWELTFDGRSAVLKQHPALFYVAWLLTQASAEQFSVAQVSNLLYRRFPIGRTSGVSSGHDNSDGSQAGSPAIQQVGNLRYSASGPLNTYAPAEPIAALELAYEVFHHFRAHPDLLLSAPWLCRQQRDADVAKVFRKKLIALEKILDHPDSDEVLKAEAERELVFIHQLQETYFVELIPPGEKTAERITTDLLDLYARLSAALDAQGNPHPIIRAFALHLLVCVLMPSVRA